MDVKNIETDNNTLNKIDNIKTPTISAYISTSIWLIVPLLTIMLFNMIGQFLKGELILHSQMFFAVVTMACSFYFVDKNAHESNGLTLISSIYNAMLLFTVIMIVIAYNPWQHILSSISCGSINLCVMIAVFLFLVFTNDKKEYVNTTKVTKENITAIIILFLIHCSRIHLQK